MTIQRKKGVPNTLKDVQKKIKRYRWDAKRKLGKKSLYSKINKGYKNLNWDKDRFSTDQLKSNITDEYFKCYRRMLQDKELRVYKQGNTFYADRQNVQGICMLKQLCCLMQNKYIKHLSNKTWNPKEYYQFYYDSDYVGRIKICNYDCSKEWKIPMVVQFLKDKQYIFDQDNMFGKTLSEVKLFIKKQLIKGKAEKWDYYFQRFLAKKD